MKKSRILLLTAAAVITLTPAIYAQEYIRVAGTKNLNRIEKVPVEDYVKGVLLHEASHYWPMEALKAQAVVCRTYALYEKKNSASRKYDVRRDIFSQVYAGKTAHRYRIDRAVDATKGEVLTYNNEIIPAYFHSTCAGHTEDASVLWDINIKPLKGVACPYCKNSPYFYWLASIPLNEMENKLKKSGYKISGITDISAGNVDPSGRLIDIKLKDSKGELVIPAKDFRQIMGPNLIKSTRFEVVCDGKSAVFKGKGWGHGAGLCQWGAYFMAKQNATYKEILEFYYPGSRIK